jgi:predicted RNA binding protein YcfA (HicA-like mRNA interferase family)
MARILLILFVVLTFGVGGCSRTCSTLSTGMSMNVALTTLETNGYQEVQMQMAGPHHAFDLPDGRTVVLHGGGTVTSIEIITNGDLAKTQRSSEVVAQFSL